MSNHRLGVLTSDANADARQLVRRYHRQMINRPAAEFGELQGVFAVCFRPGDRTGSFLNKKLIPVGKSVAAVLSYEPNNTNERPYMPLRGFRAEPNPDGSILYGEQRCQFLFDAALRPSFHAYGRALNPFKNPSLTDLMLRMDAACQKQLNRTDFLPVAPQFPRIMLGFAPTELPAFEDTPALRALAAAKLQVPVADLGANGDVLLDRLLHDVWEEQLISSHALDNHLGLLLIDAEFCTEARRSLRIFEDFTDLVGVPTWNPAREVFPLQTANPARQVLEEFHLDGATDLGQVVSGEQLDALVQAMRGHLGEQGQVFSQEEVFDALLAPSAPVKAWTQALPELRAKLCPAIAECTRDEDLLKAARRPEGALFASGAPRIQVLRRGLAGDASDFDFSPEILRRKIEANLWVDRFERQPTQIMQPRADALVGV